MSRIIPYLQLFFLSLRTQTQTPGRLIPAVLGAVALQLAAFAAAAATSVVIARASSWSVGDLLILFCVRLLGHALYSVPFQSLNALLAVLERSEWNIYLARPASPLGQLLTRRANPTTVADCLVGLALLLSCVAVQHYHVWPLVSLLLAAVVAASAELMLRCGIAGAILLWHRFDVAHSAVDDLLGSIAAYPTPLLSLALHLPPISLIPIALFAYLPTSLALPEHTGELLSPMASYIVCASSLAGAPLAFAALNRVLETWRD